MVLRALHLCSGYGGFELGLRLAGIDARTVAHVERDAYAAATLVARMADETLDQAPIWDDLTTFDGAAWRGRVDLITAGFPCQPFSSAGQQRGVDDERWIWPDIARIIADVGPRLVFLENVPQLVRLGLPHVLSDLAALGFDAEWSLYSAAAVGAPHKRERLWILAYADRDGLESLGRLQLERRNADGPGGADVGHADSTRRAALTRSGARQEGELRTGVDHEPDDAGEDVADAEGVNEREPHDAACTEPRRDARPDTGRRGAWPPHPDDHDGWRRWSEAGGPQPQVRRLTDGPPAGLADALHLGGNGLVPQVAAAALLQLAERAMT